MRIRIVLVPNLLKEPDLALICKQGCGDRMHRRVAPSFVVEPALGVEEGEEGGVRGGTEEGEGGDLEVGPEMAKVIARASIVGEEGHRVVFRDVFRVELDEFCDCT